MVGANFWDLLLREATEAKSISGFSNGLGNPLQNVFIHGAHAEVGMRPLMSTRSKRAAVGRQAHGSLNST